MYELIGAFLDQNNISYKTDIPLSRFSYFKTGGNIAFLILPDSLKKLQDLVKFFKKNTLIYTIFGNTSNCIFKDDTNIDFLINLKKIKYMDIEENEIIVGAGYSLPKFVYKCAQQGIMGFEGLEGIPGTIGGAVIMNAGSYGYDIGDNIKKVLTLNSLGKIIEYNKESLVFDFRYSNFKDTPDEIIFEIVFDILEQDISKASQIKAKMNQYKQHRYLFLERNFPNVGSVFKTDDIYRDIAKENIGYRVLLFIVRTFVHRLLRIKDNRLLNYLTFKYFNINYQKIVSQKTMNTVINVKSKTNNIEKYINHVKSISNNSLELEIEII